jgi:plasmid stabilization system protein ParE
LDRHDNPERSISFVRELRAACEELSDLFGLYPRVPGRPRLRKRVVWPYLILYEVRGEEVLIVSVRHGSRRRPR